MNKLRIDFDLPTNHLKGVKYYVPPKARSSTEIERRHELPKGSLILEQQHLGSRIGDFLLQRVEGPEDIKFVTKLLAAAGLNTSWYSFGQTDEVMRKRLKLPTLAYDFNERPMSQADLLLRGSYHLGEITELAGQVLTGHVVSDPRQDQLKAALGRTTGNAALRINCVNLADQLSGASTYGVQEIARISCLGALERAKSLAGELDCPPSLSQLPDPDSDLAIHIRRNAPNNVFEAYDEAISMYSIAR